MKIEKLLNQRSLAKTSKERSSLTLEIALCYVERGEFSDAINEYKKLTTITPNNNESELALVYRSISECYLEISDFNEAIKYASLYLKKTKLTNDAVEQQRAFVTIGRCFLCRSENLNDGVLARKSLLAAQQALINSIKCTNLLNDLSIHQIAEMKAISLLNLGHVLRSCGDFDSARNRFDQCITLARKYSLIKITYRTVYQRSELPLFQWPSCMNNRRRPSELLSFPETNELKQAISLCRTNLKLYPVRSCTDKESKMLRRNLEELLGQLYLGSGQIRTAAKVYYRLSRIDATTSSVYQRSCVKSLKINEITNKTQMAPSETHADMYNMSRNYEKLGDILSQMELHGPAIRSYQQMFLWAEAAFTQQREDVQFSDQFPCLSELVKQADAGLISTAEASWSLCAYALCAEFYRREIDFSLRCSQLTTSPVALNELARSWLSLSRALILAPKNTPTSFSISMTTTSLPGSRTVIETLNSAVATAKASECKDIIRECLEELIEYHQSCSNTPEMQKYSVELESLRETQTSQTDYPPNPNKKNENSQHLSDEENESNSSYTRFTEAMQVLSSDSEIDKCIDISGAPSDLLESPVKRRGKALCLKTNVKGESPLHVAAINGNLEHAVKLIEVMNHPINIRDGAGWLPIHEAAFHDNTDVACYLLDHGAVLDDLGCQEDSSTPLFEAIHNGSLKTAILLVNRGANIWHVNAESETLSDLINAWQPKKRCTGSSISAQTALFEQLLTAIKQKLGDDYDKWCRNRPSKHLSPKKTNKSFIDKVNEWPLKKLDSLKNSRRGKARRMVSSSSSSDEENVLRIAPPRSRKNVHQSSEGDFNPTLITSSLSTGKFTEAVKGYRDAMQTVRGSAVNGDEPNKGKRVSIKRQSTSASRGVPEDNESWLDDDIGRTKKMAKLVHYSHSRKIPDGNSNKSKVFSSSFRDIKNGIRPSPVSLADADVFDAREALSSTYIGHFPFLSQTQISPIKTKEAIGPLPTTVNGQTTTSHVPSPTTNQPSVTSTKPDYTIAPPQPGQAWCTVKVTFPDISLLLPVDSQSRSVAWLAEESSRRRLLLLDDGGGGGANSSRAHHLPIVRLRTADGALLLPSDPLGTVLLLTSGQTSELMAELMTMSSRPPMTQIRTVKAPATGPSLADKLSNQTPRLRRILTEATKTGILDLSFSSLGGADCAKVLLDYANLNAKQLTEVYLDGNMLSPKDMPASACLGERSSEGALISAFNKIASSDLKVLTLAENFLTLESVITLLSGHRTLSLVRLNLSHNPLLPTSTSSITTAHSSSPAWLLDLPDSESTVFSVAAPASSKGCIVRLLSLCPKLARLEVAGCSLTTVTLDEALRISPSGWRSPQLSSPPAIYLSELDASWNPLTTDAGNEAEFLIKLLSPTSVEHLSLSCLQTIRLRGCLATSGKTQPRLLVNRRTQRCWMLASFFDKGTDGDDCSRASGDQFISSLAQLLDLGKCQIQTLDVGCCNLSASCLMSLQRLLAAPSTSLTTLICDGNPHLRSVSPHSNAVWAHIFTTSAQASSALASLCIDMPRLMMGCDLEESIKAVSRKLSASSSPNPLQELSLYSITSDASSRLEEIKRQPVSTFISYCNRGWDSDPLPISKRFLLQVAELFSARFGKLATIASNERYTVFSVR